MNDSEERFPLDEAAIQLIAELDEQIKNASVATSAVAHYFARQHGIQGQFRIAENRRELILKAQRKEAEP